MRSSTLALLVFCASAGLANAQPQAVSLLDSLPTSFELNRGQAGGAARLVARGAGYTLLLEDSRAVLRLRSGGEISLRLLGALERGVAGESILPGTINYFIGRNPQAWLTGIPTFARARYAQVYPGIDLVYHGDRGRLEYDFEVAPGVNPGLIRMRFDGAQRLTLEANGDLALHTANGVVTVERPTVYQNIAGMRRSVEGGFRLDDDGAVSVRLGPYDSRHPLVIDPVLVYSTLLGQFQDHGASGIIVDGTGASYIAGYSAVSFDVAESDAFVAKLNPTGTALMFATYFGGAGSDQANAIALDAVGNVYVTGLTDSPDFPTASPSQGSHGGDGDAFVTKLSVAGDAVLYSTFLGGSGWEEGWDIVVDASSNIHVVGMTQSADFPLAAAFQTTLGGASDAFVTKYDSTGSRVASTYLGGSGDDTAAAAIAGPAGSLLLTGWSYSPNFPTTAGSSQPVHGGDADAFLVRMNTSTWTLDYSTFIGGTDWDTGSALAADASGAVYVTGSTTSVDFPVSAGALQTSASGGLGDGFVTKLSGDGSSRIYSTYLGGTDQDFSDGLAVTAGGVAVVAGLTASDDFPTAAALQPSRASSGDAFDAFVTKLNAAGTGLVYSSFLGATESSSTAHAVALGPGGDAFVVGAASSSRFPTTAGAFLPTVERTIPSVAFVARISDATPACTFFVRPGEVVVGAGGIAIAREAVTVVAPSGCVWAASSPDPWITLTVSGGTGIGHVPYIVAGNGGATRTGSITVAGQTVNITQMGSDCTYVVSGVPIQPSSGGSGATATVSTAAGCPWVVTSFASWVSASPPSGTGNGVLTFTVQPNTQQSPRTGLLSVGPSFGGALNVSVSQEGFCDVSLSPTSAGPAPGPGGTGFLTINVSPANCLWTAISNVPWLSLSTPVGVGSATVPYTATANLGAARSGSITIGDETFVVSQQAAPSGNVPWTLPPSPASGSGPSATFTFNFFDNNGATNLDVVNVLVNNYLDGRVACYIYYYRSSNLLHLVNDAGNALLPGLPLDGSLQSRGNSQCLVDGSESSAVMDGNLLTLTLKIFFEAGFAGNKVVYTAARDLSGNSSGFVQQAVWNVPGGGPGSPAAISMTPSRGGGGAYSFVFTYSDGNGYADLESATVLLNGFLNGVGGCYLGYHVSSNRVFLVNDAGAGYVGSLLLDGTGSVENGQCRIRGSGSGAVGSGTTLTLTLSIEFKGGFGGNRVFYLSAQDATTTSGWQAMGSWTVP